jgi:hypothetical protein
MGYKDENKYELVKCPIILVGIDLLVVVVVVVVTVVPGRGP